MKRRIITTILAPFLILILTNPTFGKGISGTQYNTASESIVDGAFVPNECVIEFEENSPAAAVADLIVERKQQFKTLFKGKNVDYVDGLNNKNKLKSMKKVFSKYQTFRERSIKKNIYQVALHQKIQNVSRSFLSQSEAIMIKNAEKSEARDYFHHKLNQRYSKKNLNVTQERKIPYLGKFYKAVFDGPVDCLQYEKDSNIKSSRPNYIMKGNSEDDAFPPTNVYPPQDTFYSTQNSWEQTYDDLWALKADKLNMEPAWSLSKGEGVVVAVVDSGVDYNHDDINANIWINACEDINGNNIIDEEDFNGVDDACPGEEPSGYIDDIRGWDFVNDDNDPVDGNGHGTHVAGTIAAENNDIGIIGVAPQAKIMPIKGLGDDGRGPSSGLADGIIYAADNGAHVINNSWGCREACPSNPVTESAVRYAHAAGVVVVFAAGNSSDDVAQYSPKNIAESIAVASSNVDDHRSRFSNRGVLIDVAAPGGGPDTFEETNEIGRNILSLNSKQSNVRDNLTLTDDQTEDLFFRTAGTSMAAPHVSGLSALILSLNSHFTPEQVRQALIKGADQSGEEGFNVDLGYGRINASNSLSVNNPLGVMITEPTIEAVNSSEGIQVQGVVEGDNYVGIELFYYPVKEPESLTLVNSVFWDKGDDPPLDWNEFGYINEFIDDGRYVLLLKAYVDAGNGEREAFEDRQLMVVENEVEGEITPAKSIYADKTGNVFFPSWFDGFDGWYVMSFEPQSDGVINRLGGIFGGTQEVFLWSDDSNTPLRQIEITSGYKWTYKTIDPVEVESGKKYYVGMYFEFGNELIELDDVEFPYKIEELVVTGSCQGTTFDQAIPFVSENLVCQNTQLIGLADVGFMPFNEAPTIAKIDDQAVSEGETININVLATDVDGDALILSAKLADESPIATIGGTFMDNGDGTGVLTMQPQVGDVGRYKVIIEVNDGGITEEASFHIAITTNNFNSVETFPAQLLDGGQVSVLDSSGRKMMGYFFTALTDGEVTKLGGNFAEGRYVYLWDLESGDSLLDTLARTYINSNFSWQYVNIHPVRVEAGKRYFVGTYFEEDREATRRIDISNFSVNLNGISVDASAEVSDFRRPSQNGPLVTDQLYGMVDVAFFPGPPQANNPPTFIPIEDQTILIGEQFQVPVFATDEDQDVPIRMSVRYKHGDIIHSIEFVGANFIEWGSGRAVFEWTPQLWHEGQHTFVFTADDGRDQTSMEVTIEVKAPNLPPIFEPIEPIVINAGESLDVPIVATDPNGDDVFIQAARSDLRPEWISFDGQSLTLTPSIKIAGGNYIVRFRAHDRQEAVYMTVNIRVEANQQTQIQLTLNSKNYRVTRTGIWKRGLAWVVKRNGRVVLKRAIRSTETSYRYYRNFLLSGETQADYEIYVADRWGNGEILSNTVQYSITR